MTSKNSARSRRAFLRETGLVVGGAWLGLQAGDAIAAVQAARSRAEAGAALEHLDASQAGTLGAMADQIYPPDDTAGARELGVVYFMDFAAGGFMAGAWPMVVAGMTDLEARAAELGSSFDELPFDRQTRLLEEVESTPFFGIVHFLTLLGCFTLPAYGGNRDEEGWAQLGFVQRHAWQPPFGYYDAAVNTEGDANEDA